MNTATTPSSHIDLHIHSNHSLDGSCSVRELIQLSVLRRMKTIALTDHNTVSGVAEAIRLGSEYGIRVIPAIEIDCTFCGVNLHMTGYDIDIADNAYLSLEDAVNAQAKQTSWEAAHRFIDHFQLNLSDEILQNIAIHDVIVPENLAAYLLQAEAFSGAEFLLPYRAGGSRSDNPNVNFYWDYFSQGKLAHVEHVQPSAASVIDLIHRTGGIAVIAHPGVNFRGKDTLLMELLAMVDGIEAFSSYHTAEECQAYAALADTMQKKITCGSDFHGVNKPSIQIGKIPGDHIAERVCF